MHEPARPIDDEKMVIFVAPYFTPTAPMAYSLCLALPHLMRRGWRIAVVGEEVIAPEAEIVVKIPQSQRNFLLRRAALRREVARLRKRWPSAVVAGLPGFPLDADLTAFHFSQSLWLQKQFACGFSGARALLRMALHGWLWCWESLHLAGSKGRLLAPVSESMAAHLQPRAPDARIETLPNCYDVGRFNQEVRDAHATAARQRFGFSDRDYVFTFVSQGHYERKGFWLAVEALHLLRQTREAIPFNPRFLVIGGQPSTLRRLTARLDREYPGWPGWLTFAGMTREPEVVMSAANAFLFPSYFEAFCLAEIEAAALGLPLLLTGHGGTEMILSDGSNGLLLESDARSIASTLGVFLGGRSKLGEIDQGGRRPANFVPSVGKALKPESYAVRLEILLEKSRKTGRTAR